MPKETSAPASEMEAIETEATEVMPPVGQVPHYKVSVQEAPKSREPHITQLADGTIRTDF